MSTASPTEPGATTAPNLFELIARCWTLPGPISHAVFSHDGSHVAFSTESALAISPIEDPERPEARIRFAADTGQQSIMPREKPVRPLALVEDAQGPAVPQGDMSFLACDGDGQLQQISPRGLVVRFPLRTDAPVTALARDPRSPAIAVGSGSRVFILSDGTGETTAAHDAGHPITALAYSPSGRRLAVAHEAGISFLEDDVWIGGVDVDDVPQVLSFNADGSMLACGLRNPGFALIHMADLSGELVHDYPTPVRSFAWSHAAGALATSGAFRTVAWSVTEDGFGEALHAGRNGLVVVERVTASPNRPLVATGYASGLVCIAQIGATDEMLVRGSGGPVTALTWAADGVHLALGDADGNAALAAFPASLFK